MLRHRKFLVTSLLLGCIVALAGCGGADSGVGPAGAGLVGNGAASNDVQQGGGGIIDSITSGYSAPATTLPVSSVIDPLADPNSSSTLDDTGLGDSLATAADPFSSVGLDDTSSVGSAMDVSLSDNLGSDVGDNGMSLDSALADSNNSLGGDSATNPVTQAVSNLSLGADATDNLALDPPEMNDPALADPNADPSLP